MKKLSFFILLSNMVVFASPAFVGGITYKFGSGLKNAGITAKVITSGEDKKAVVGAGVTYYPWEKKGKKFGLDVSAGYNFESATIMGGWDFLQNQPSVSLGFNKEISSDDDDTNDDIQDATCNKDTN